MKKHATFFLGLGAESWHLARVCGAEKIELREIGRGSQDLNDPKDPREPDGETKPADAAQVASALREIGYAGERVCLGLPAGMVMSARIDCSDLPRRRRRSAMIYRLEEELPLEAERFTADFLQAVGGMSLGLAVETSQVKSILEELSQVGIEVAAICPTALLAIMAASRAGEDESCDYTLVATDHRVDLFRMIANQPASWYSCGLDAPDIARRLKGDMLAIPPETDPPTARAIGGLGWEIADPLAEQTGLRFLEPKEAEKESAFVAAARSAASLLAGQESHQINLRLDELAAAGTWERTIRSLRWTAALLMFLLVVLCIGFCWRGMRYDRLAEEYERRQAAEYSRVAPNSPIPQNVRSRMRSELSRLAGTSGGAEMPDQPIALETLRSVMAAAPGDLRLRIVDLRVNPTDIVMEGQVRSHSDAEVFAQSLKRAGLFVEPPRTETLAHGGVSFTLAAKPAGPAPLAAAKGGKP